jgi:hypothetical protein
VGPPSVSALDVNLPGISARHAAKVIVDVEIDASKLHPTHVAMKVAIIAGHPPTRLPKISCSASRCARLPARRWNRHRSLRLPFPEGISPAAAVLRIDDANKDSTDTAVNQRFCGWRKPCWVSALSEKETYGPVYSNFPIRDDLPEYSKLISGSVSLRMRERRTAAVPA